MTMISPPGVTKPAGHAGYRQRIAKLYDVPGSRPRIPAMDGIRGLAVLLVFFVHYDTLFAERVPDGSITRALSGFLGTIGHAGVELFFALSGYLIYGFVIGKAVSYPAFLGRRARRIYPTFLCVLAVYVVLSWAFPARSKLPPQGPDAFWYVLKNAALLPGITPIRPIITVAWSLSYEIFFYLVIPLVVSAFAMRRWRPGQRAGFFLLVAVAYGCYCWGQAGATSHPRLLAFIAGILIYEILACHRLKEGLTHLGSAGAALIFLVGLVLVYGILKWPGRPDFLTIPHHQSCAYAVAASIACFLFTGHVLSGSGHLAALLSWAPLRWLGNMSYSYYLIHGLTLNGLALVIASKAPAFAGAPVWFWLCLPGALALTLLTGTLLYALVEKPWSFQRPGPVSHTGERRTAPDGVSYRNGAL